MLKAFTLAGALMVVAFGAARAQEQAPAPTNQRTSASPYGASSIHANGRCNGISYGTGARRCGSRSGGPSGGISDRN